MTPCLDVFESPHHNDYGHPTVVGSLIDTTKYIEISFYSLPNEYNPIVTSILSRTNAYTIFEIESLLMNIEGEIEK
ncbi:hypothetical protein CR513_08193, partial [Mucuna pruriens]